MRSGDNCNVIYTLLQQRNNQKLRNDIVLWIRVTIRPHTKPQEGLFRNRALIYICIYQVTY